ncbi:hypothetical protein K503DRAFT_742437 [Rhizopogon vinicolor AM-OR11-026]|uniref:CinA C-terminal domain-containing protein n=1 Tax=Rhizopogon vinicolor AM-OR11-026 TaxID=1314800 RepID=A0A1B7MYE7_9AGAM|nr:hypothetical protein K503DRAFT_742437 [Rhizopogon vinicolor AM-OR11-026]
MQPVEDYSFPPASFKPLLAEISGLLKSSSSTLAVAETTTGTLYTTKSRKTWAGWTDDNLVDYKGPTPELVTGLAVSVREQMDVTYCIGESGATGPTVPGPPFTHVAGQTCIAVVSQDGFATRVVNTGIADREKNMVAFTKATLELLRDVLAGEVKLGQHQSESSSTKL